jgi:hypothetical protein
VFLEDAAWEPVAEAVLRHVVKPIDEPAEAGTYGAAA